MVPNVYMVPNPAPPNACVQFDPDICNGCNNCVENCRTDVLMPNPEKKQPPIVLYPDECWYCGCCVEDCPREGAIHMVHPLNQSISVNWVRKKTGRRFNLGLNQHLTMDACQPEQKLKGLK